MTPLEEQVERALEAADELAAAIGSWREKGPPPQAKWDRLSDALASYLSARSFPLLPLEVTDRGGNVSCGRCGQRMAMCECPVKAEEVRHCAVFSSPSEAESFLGETQEVQVDRLARFFHSEFSSDRIAEWDDLEPLTQRIWNTEALRAYVFMLTGTNPLDELETAGPDQPGRPEGVADAPSGPSRDIAPKKEDRS